MSNVRKHLVNYFIGEPEEVSLKAEILFYSIMAMPIVIAITTIIIA